MSRLFAPRVLCALIALPSIVVTSPAGDADVERLRATAEAATRRLDEWLAPLPLPQLTVVADRWNSPRAGTSSAGQVVGITRWLAPAKDRGADRLLIGAIARQYWPAVADADASQWFFDGLRRYSAVRAIHVSFLGTHDYSRRYFGGFVPHVVGALPLSLNPEDPRPPVRDFAELGPGARDAVAAARMVDAMYTLERSIGWPTIQLGLATFLEQWRDRRPAPRDFVAVLNQVSGRDLTAFFDEVQRTDAVFDYGISALESSPSGAPSHPYQTTVGVSRVGSAVFPDGVDVAVTFEDGTEAREHWNGREPGATFQFTSRSPARAARIDPDRILLLEAARGNNVRRLTPPSRTPALGWTAQWAVWLQNVMLTYGGLF